jgi:sporulation protein YlmC with PRC-barrel domain
MSVHDVAPVNNKEKPRMNRFHLISSVATCICLGLGASAAVAQTAATPAAKAPPPVAQKVDAARPAAACLSDVRSFDEKMQKDGYWLGGAGNAYGYPMGGYGYGYLGPIAPGSPAGRPLGYQNARPGYEIHILLASASILAQNGQQQPCEDVLTTTRAIYTTYAANLHGSGMMPGDGPGWEQQQIKSALPVADQKTAFRSDQLIDTDVRNAKNESLGSVHDIVMDPKTGKIAYLSIARGGVFGFGETFVPVPWDEFKTTPNVGLVVLDTTKAVMDAAPTVTYHNFALPGQFDQESQKVDAYWKTNLTNKTSG